MSPRGIALALGVAFAVLTALELVIGELRLGGMELLHRTTKANILHWLVALTMLGAFFARSPSASRKVLRVGGIVLLVISVAGIFWADGFGASLGFGTGMPLAYNAYHGAAALLALVGGLLLSAEPA